MHFAVRMYLWGGPFRTAICLKRVEARHTRIRDRVGVVIAIDVADVRLAALEIELLHLKQPALDDIDRLWMERCRAAGEIGLADHMALVRDVDDHEVVR